MSFLQFPVVIFCFSFERKGMNFLKTLIVIYVTIHVIWRENASVKTLFSFVLLLCDELLSNPFPPSFAMFSRSLGCIVFYCMCITLVWYVWVCLSMCASVLTIRASASCPWPAEGHSVLKLQYVCDAFPPIAGVWCHSGFGVRGWEWRPEERLRLWQQGESSGTETITTWVRTECIHGSCWGESVCV